MKILLVLIVLFIVILIALSGSIMSRVKQPTYKIESKSANIETRVYDPILIASVQVHGDRQSAIKQGFRILAAYIFGDNASQSKLSMTAPVSQKMNEKVEMTAPVMQTNKDNESWIISFVMPKKFTKETLPLPKNKEIIIKEIARKHYVVIRFSGSSSQENLDKHLKILQAYIEKNKLNTQGAPIFAYYNPPWTLPFLRRNEILFELSNN